MTRLERIEKLLEEVGPEDARLIDAFLQSAADLMSGLSADDEVVSVIIHDRLDLALATRRGTSLH